MAVKATPQGGILEGGNPSKYDPKNPIIIFIIQASIIIILCRLLQWPLSKLRQPRVIAEVIGGILLGPSVFGRIPGFTAAIFPTDSIPNLSLVANLGLVFFLFLVGVETDLRFLVSNWRVALSVSALGMILPFGLGCAIAYGLYHQFGSTIDFGTYVLFIGIAMAITAFPVLCRILTELKLLRTNVGVIVLSAGVGNDVVGWILLALCVALVNAGNGLTALWVLLVCVGYALVLGFAVRPAFMWFLRRTGSLHNGPDQFVVAITLLLVLASAFFTQVIGVHAIFGAFMIGLICPHEGGFAIKLTEKIEDLVSALFLPLYFALSGLSTNIGLLDNGITWGYVIGIIAIAFIAKVAGGTIASRLNGLVWRESFTIGVLMSCKGLVELIVLNIGLQAKILSVRVFTMFVVMALVTTFATTPLTSFLYPDWYQKKLDRWRRGEIDWDGNELDRAEDADDAADGSGIARDKLNATSIQKLLVYLRFDNLPSIITFISLLGSGDNSTTPPAKVHHLQATSSADSDGADGAREAIRARKRALQVHGVRLVELTDRGSSVMKVSEADAYTVRDPVVNTFRTFGRLNNVAVSAGVTVIPERSYAETIINQGSELKSDLVLIPWSETGGMSEEQLLLAGDGSERFAGGAHSTFISSILRASTNNVGIFVNMGFGGPSLDQQRPPAIRRTVSSLSIRSDHTATTAPILDRSHHIFAPYFGGADDQFALRLVLQLARNEAITATIVFFDLYDQSPSASSSVEAKSANLSAPRRQREVDASFFSAIRDSCPSSLASRVVFQTQSELQSQTTPTTGAGSGVLPLVLSATKDEVGRTRGNAGDLVVIGRNSVFDELTLMATTASPDYGDVVFEAREALGTLGEAMVRKSNGIRASLLVIQASETTARPLAPRTIA